MDLSFFNAGAAAPATTSQFAFCTGFEQYDTRKGTSDDYGGITGKEIWAMLRDPPSVAKEKAQWFIPSTYRASDAREFNRQREAGEFWFLCLDEDDKAENNLSLDDIDQTLVKVCGPVARLIYSTRSSTAERRKWRALIPLHEPISGADYADTVAAFNAALIEASAGVLIPDPALERAAQLIYLPNRGEHYDSRGMKGDRLDLTPGHDIIKRREIMRAKMREAEEAARARRERKRAEALANPGSNASIIDAFNGNTTVADELARNGYIMSRNGRDWISPNSTTGNYAVRDYGDFWISLSGSDSMLEIGNAAPSGARIGDAFDLFVHYEHGGDFKAAIKAYAKEIGEDHASRQGQDVATALSGIGQGQEAPSGEAETGIRPTPFKLRDSTAIPPRQWLYGKHLIRHFISTTVSPGGLGKSSMIGVETLAMATGRDLLGDRPPHPVRVWLWNGEDPREEVERRITAACMHYGIKSEDIGDRLLMDSGRDVPIKLAAMNGSGVMVARPVADDLIKAIREAQIDVLVIDPFVTSHEVSENDNTAINAVVSEWRRIADVAGCAIELVHHVSKAGAVNKDLDIYASRGAMALIDGVRSGRALVRMSDEERTKFGVEDDETTYFCVSGAGKANMAPPAKRVWRRMVGVALGNGGGFWPEGDHVGVCTTWTPPDPMEGISTRDLQRVQEAIAVCHDAPRQNEQSSDWAGYVVAETLGMDVAPGATKGERTGLQNAARAKVRQMLKAWIASGSLAIDSTEDKRTGRDVKLITVGDPVTEADIRGQDFD